MKIRNRLLLGVLLVVGGGLLMLQSLDIISGSWQNIIWALITATGAVFFLINYFSNTDKWAWLIPGGTLLGLTALNLFEILSPETGDLYGGLILLGSIGLSFLFVFFTNRINWWSVIPGGVLLTLGVVSWADAANLFNIDSSVIFFFGVGLTFLILFLIPTPYGRLTWPLYPAIVLILIGFFFVYQDQQAIWNIVGPAAIVIAGLYFLIGAFRGKGGA